MHAAGGALASVDAARLPFLVIVTGSGIVRCCSGGPWVFRTDGGHGCHKGGLGGRKSWRLVERDCAAREINSSRVVSASVLKESVDPGSSAATSQGADCAAAAAIAPRIVPSDFESASQEQQHLEVSTHRSRFAPSETKLTAEDDSTSLHHRSSSSSTSNCSALPQPQSQQPRQKRIWQGLRRPRRTPPMLPWTEDDFARKSQLIMESILSEAEEERVVVNDVLDSWLGKITRVELTQLIKDLGSRRRPFLALDVFGWMQNQKRRLKPTRHVYSSIIGMLGRAGMLTKAREIFDSQRRGKNPDSVHLYNAMMGAYVKSGSFGRAWTLYEELCDRGLEADEVTFNTLLNGISRANMPLRVAEEIFSKMKDVGVSPGRYTYNTLITVFSKCGHWEGTAAVLEEMRSAQKMPDLCTFNTVIGMYGRVGRYEEAMKVFDALISAGFDPDVVTYTNLMQTFSRARMPHAAIGQFFEMQRVGCTPDVRALSLVVHIYGRAGLEEEAAQVFERMRVAGFEPNIVAWSSLIQAYARKGMLEKANSRFADMEKSGCRPDALLYSVMMTAYRDAELPVHAASLFRRMQSQGVAPNAACFNTLIHAFSESGQREDAKALHEQMVRAGFTPDKLSRRFLSNRGKHLLQSRVSSNAGT